MIRERLVGAHAKAEGWRLKPPGGDPYISAFGEAISMDFIAEGDTSEFFQSYFRDKPKVGASHALTHFLRAIQRQLIGCYPEYPHGFETPQRWLHEIQEILRDFDRSGVLIADMFSRELQSNVSERYKAVKAFGVLVRDLGRMEDEFSLASIGSAQNAGPNHLASGIGFTPPNWVDRQVL